MYKYINFQKVIGLSYILYVKYIWQLCTELPIRDVAVMRAQRINAIKAIYIYIYINVCNMFLCAYVCFFASSEKFEVSYSLCMHTRTQNWRHLYVSVYACMCIYLYACMSVVHMYARFSSRWSKSMSLKCGHKRAYCWTPRWYSVWRETVKWYLQGKTEDLREKPVPVPLLSIPI